MITKEQARTIAENYLKSRNRQYISLSPSDQATYSENYKAQYGKFEGQRRNVFSIDYGEMWGGEERYAFIKIDAITGEVLYTLNSHGVVEELEDE